MSRYFSITSRYLTSCGAGGNVRFRSVNRWGKSWFLYRQRDHCTKSKLDALDGNHGKDEYSQESDQEGSCRKRVQKPKDTSPLNEFGNRCQPTQRPRNIV